MLVLACSAAFSANAADPGLKTFAANTPALAEEVNGNFEYLNSKLDDLLSGTSEGDADCTTDANALRDLVEKGVDKITFDGDCNGPLYPDAWTRLTGSGKGTSSINGILEDSSTTEVIWNRNGFLEIKNTTINSGALIEEPTMIGSDQGSEIRLDNVDVNGPDAGEDDSTCLHAKQGSFKLTDVKISGCNEALSLYYGSHAEIKESSGGVTLLESNMSDWWAVSVVYNSTLRVKGGTFKALNPDPDDPSGAIGVNWNSHIRIDGGTIEGLSVKRNSTARLRGGEIKDILRVQKNSYALLERQLTFTPSGTDKPVIRVSTGEVDIISLDTPLNLSEFRASNGSTINFEGKGITDTATIDSLDFGTGSLSLGDIRINSTSAQLSEGSFSLYNSVLSINGLLTNWNSNGWVGNGSTISATSYEGNDCDTNAFQIGKDDSSTITIPYPTCP